MILRSNTRHGFTLVEVLAALVLGAILLAAVYSTLDIMMRSIRVGKEAVQSLQVIRGTAIRLQTDIRQNLSLLSTAPSVQPAPPPTDPPTDATTPEPGQFNFCVQGDEYSLTLYGSQTPQFSRLDAETPNSVYSDLRTISYYCQPGTGLVRKETLNVLSGSADSDEAAQEEILAPEVQEMSFQYFDSSTQSWMTSWDGTTMGPPAAIEIKLMVQMPEIPGVPPRSPVRHRLVIAIPAFGSPVQGGTTQ
ncbi:MAG: prepilin-type N-terminal cleavage/methylation domain-containing protein [Planctomycetia bacterium]|nr:prepilin-type N-terminal cleavage/methylation domain-containing protein [Planctomycetia bacterium]